MSSNVFSQQNSTTIQTRRTPTRGDEFDNNSQRNTNHRSLSGKFRNLFQKHSSSPNRSSTNDRLPASPLPRRRSPSPEQFPASPETPRLRAPLVEWPFGKKKTKLTPEIDSRTKIKNSRKSKKKPLPPPEISTPIYTNEHQTSIHGQTFVPRTPELAHGGTGRTQSSSSYETTTKGFRDYVVIDNSRSSQQVVIPTVDNVTPLPYISDRHRSPSSNHQHLPYTNIEYSHHRDISTSPSSSRIISNIENTPTLHPQRHLESVTQRLAEKTPILPSPITITTNSNQWKGVSSSSLNNSEIRSTTSSRAVDFDIPKLHAPLIPRDTKPYDKDTKRFDRQFHFDEIYNSPSTINKPLQTNRSYISTYNSSPTTNTVHNINSYPGLDAILAHHINRNSAYYNERLDGHQTHRFDASTTTSNDFHQQQQQWSTDSIISPTDGYIRPLTPSKSYIQPDVSVIHFDVDDLRSSSRTPHYTSSEMPVTYRSSATLYTRDKQNFTNGGEIRTWSLRDNEDVNNNKKSSTSIFIERARDDQQVVPPAQTDTDYQYKPVTYESENNNYDKQNDEKYGTTYEYERQQQQPPQQQYSHAARYFSSSRYSDNTNNDRISSFTRPSILHDRDNNYDQSIYSYKDTGRTQESLDGITSDDNSDIAVRHYSLKRTDSYNGLGLVLSSDAETRLNHRIRDVEPSSPGSRIGLRKNDRIVNVNGINVENVEFGDVLVLIKQGLNKNDLQVSVINDSVLI